LLGRPILGLRRASLLWLLPLWLLALFSRVGLTLFLLRSIVLRLNRSHRAEQQEDADGGRLSEVYDTSLLPVLPEAQNKT